VKDLLSNVGSGGGAPAQASAAGGAAADGGAAEETKEEAKEEGQFRVPRFLRRCTIPVTALWDLCLSRKKQITNTVYQPQRRRSQTTTWVLVSSTKRLPLLFRRRTTHIFPLYFKTTLHGTAMGATGYHAQGLTGRRFMIS
jgi:hypothetical protein